MAKILIVDDERDVIELVRFSVERAGHTVFEALDGAEAMEIATREQPDVIVMDVMMPNVDGYSATVQLNQNEKTHNIPVIVLTAKGNMREMFGMTPNVRHYIDKPFEPRFLQERIDELLKESKGK